MTLDCAISPGKDVTNKILLHAVESSLHTGVPKQFDSVKSYSLQQREMFFNRYGEEHGVKSPDMVLDCFQIPTLRKLKTLPAPFSYLDPYFCNWPDILEGYIDATLIK